MDELVRYIEAWTSGDPARIAHCVTPDCVIIECYGPVYRGRDRVLQWARAWFEAGGVVHAWDVRDRMVAGDRQVAEWTFTCTWGGRRSTFDGCSVARARDGRIARLREYATSAPLYDWTGEWR